MPANEPSLSKDSRGKAWRYPSRARSARSAQTTPGIRSPGHFSGYASPYRAEEPELFEWCGHHHECCERSAPTQPQCYPAGPPASQATLVSTPIPISVPMPVPGGGCRGQSAPIVINPPAAQPAPPQPPPPPPPEPRPSPAQEMASAMMLTIVDYMRRRLDRQLARMSEDDKRKQSKSELPHMTSLSPDRWSTLPLTPLAPMPSAESPTSALRTAHPKKRKKKKGKGTGSSSGSSSDEGAWFKDARPQKHQPLQPTVQAISKQGADIVEKLQSEISPDEKSDSASPEDEVEEEGEQSPMKRGRCPWTRICCLGLWLVLLLAALGVAIAYLLFPNEIGDVLCHLGIDKLTGQGAVDESNDLNISKLLDEAQGEEEWGRSIFDVKHIADESPSSDSLRDDQGYIEVEYDEETNSSSSVVPSTLTSTVARPTTSPSVTSSIVKSQTPFSFTSRRDDIEDVEDVYREDDPAGRIDFHSFIDIAAFGRHVLTPSTSNVPAVTRRNGRCATNSTTDISSTRDVTVTPLSGIHDLLVRFGLATGRTRVRKVTATQVRQPKEAITTDAPMAVEVDDEGYDWPVFGSPNKDTVKKTEEYRGRVTLGHFRIPLARDGNDSAHREGRPRTHGVGKKSRF